MVYLAGLALIILLVMLVLRWFSRAKPRSIAKLMLGVGVGLALVLGAVFVVTGRFTAAAPFLLSSVGALMRQRWLLQMIMQHYLSAPLGSGPIPSEVRTRLFCFQMDRQSGRLSGRVEAGGLAGQSLDSLSLAQLKELMEDARHRDKDGARLLRIYLTQRQSAGAQGKAGAARGGMSREEALEILGLGPDAAEADVKDAHRRLIRKLHPDQGGSDYLAAKINLAKDTLLSD